MATWQAYLACLTLPRDPGDVESLAIGWNDAVGDVLHAEAVVEAVGDLFVAIPQPFAMD